MVVADRLRRRLRADVDERHSPAPTR
jgi:hypothetical protein